MKQRSLLLRLHNESSLKAEESNSFDLLCPPRPPCSVVVTTVMSPLLRNSNSAVDDYENMEIDVQSSIDHDDGGSSALTDDIVDDWSLEDDETSTDLYPAQAFPQLSDDQPRTSLYSFYFEDALTVMTDDDISLALCNNTSFGEDDSLLDGNHKNDAALWTASPPGLMSQVRQLSPAQVSLSSLDFMELQQAYSV